MVALVKALESYLDSVALGMLHPEHIDESFVSLVFALNHFHDRFFLGLIQDSALAVIA